MGKEEPLIKNLFCPYTATCEVYQRQSANKAMRLRLDIIEELRGNYRCLAFYFGEQLKDELGFNTLGQECSHIRLLNLVSKFGDLSK